MQTIIAVWLKTQEPGFDYPHSVFWEDGSKAIAHKNKIRQWQTFTRPQSPAHPEHLGLVLHRPAQRDIIKTERPLPEVLPELFCSQQWAVVQRARTPLIDQCTNISTRHRKVGDLAFLILADRNESRLSPDADFKAVQRNR